MGNHKEPIAGKKGPATGYFTGTFPGIPVVPKVVARVSLCGLHFTIYDNMKYEIPTEEQRENLKKVFGIEVEVVEDGK